MVNISLTYSMRSNLLSLQAIADQSDITQSRLATGLKVSSPIDNPQSYYTAASLSNRSKNLTALLDSMGQSIQALKNTANTLSSGINMLEQAKAIANQALDNLIPGDPDDPPPPPTAKPITKTDINNIMTGNGISGTVVSTADELKAALNNAAAGDTIVVLGKINFNDEGITVKNGVNLVGAESVIRDNNLGDQFYLEKNQEADISFNFTGNTNSVGIMLQSNTYVSDISVNYHTINKTAQTYSAVRTEGGKNIVINNLSIDVSTPSSSMIAMEAIYNKSGEINLTGTLNITMDAFGGKAIHGDYSAKVNQMAASVINMSLAGSGVDAFRGGFMNLQGTSNIKILTSGNIMSYGNNTISGVINVNFAQTNVNNTIFAVSNTNFKSTALIKVDSVDDVVNIISKTTQTDKWEAGAKIIYSSPTKIGKVWEAAVAGAHSGAIVVDLHDGTDLASPPYSWTELSYLDMPDKTNADDIIWVPDSKKNAEINDVLESYDQLINDSHYKGVNLLKNQNLKVIFNEDRSSSLNINGVNASIAGLNLDNVNWRSKEDVEKTVKDLETAINDLRMFSSDFGNYYNIAETRQTFTNNIINILDEGADKLTLADMNEESANMLSLQTTRQLAINALSLASQASQSILRLF